MIFESVCSESKLPLWGCPRLSDHGAGWMIDFYCLGGVLRSVEVAKGPALEWIKGNGKEVERMRSELAVWLGSK